MPFHTDTICFERSTWWNLMHNAWGGGLNYMVKNKNYIQWMKMLHCPRKFSCCKHKSLRILNWLTLLWKTRDWLRNLQCNVSLVKFWIPSVFCCRQQILHSNLGSFVHLSNKPVAAYSTLLTYRFQNFYKQGEREMLLTEISLLRNHVYSTFQSFSFIFFQILHAILILLLL